MNYLLKAMARSLCFFIIFILIFPPLRTFSQTVTASFNIPDTVCLNSPVNIVNTSTNASSYYWNFCVANITQAPTGTNLGNPNGALSQPVFMDYVFYNNNYYGFSINHFPGALIRLDFGSSLLNTPTAIDMGNFGGIIPPGYGSEGIQIVQNEGKWYAIIVGGYTPSGSTPRILKIDFGADLLNLAPVATDWGNIGTMSQPLDLHVFKENNQWYGLTINAENNSVTRFSFTNSFDNTPTAVNLGTFGLLSYPTGIYAINDNGNWRVFVTNNGGGSRLVRLDFGTSLLNTPSAVNLGSIGGSDGMRDITIIKYCDQITGFSVNATTRSIYRLDFSTLSSVPIVTNLGNTGALSTPHSISKLFRVNEDLYSFVTNVGSNTITRLKFSGCTNANIASSALQNPLPIRYDVVGSYNINLTIDDGLPTQASLCKKIYVKDCRQAQDTVVINDYTEVLSLSPCKNFINVGDASKFKAGDTVLLIQMKGAMIDSTNSTAFGDITDYRNAGTYEFNYVKSRTGNQVELLNVISRPFDVPDGKVQLIRVPYYQSLITSKVLTCKPWNGTVGGVLAFNVANDLTLNADIDVSGKGFRGGAALSNPVFNCNTTGFIFPDNTGMFAARKGEGVFNTSTLLSGRGKLANGGGGGNSTNSGGAGGGNGGIGGTGGRQFTGCGNVNFINGGIGGLALPFSSVANKIFLGGGGGAGHMNDVPALGAGGNGGGIAIINCGSLTSNGFSIYAKGETPVHLTGTNDDGRSGGGAGGTVLLNYATTIGPVGGSVKGGSGDYATPPMLDAHGPGGGGGGGIFWISKPAVGPELILDLNGGTNGINSNLGNDPWGATAGTAGSVLTDLVLSVAIEPFKANIDSVRMNKTEISCSQYNFEGLGYTNTSAIIKWEWSFGDGSIAATQNASHTYTSTGNFPVKLVITDANGCKDSIQVPIQAAVLYFDFNYKLDICDPLTVQFNAVGTTTTNAYWDFGDGTVVKDVLAPSHSFAALGNYKVRYAVGNGLCTDTIEKIITIDIIRENIILTPDTTICFGSVKQLRTVPSLSFCWTPVTYLDNPNSPNPTTSATQNIRYYFTAEVTGTNLITNGNFSQGNSGFVSSYVYAPASGFPEGTYNVGNNIQAWHSGLVNCADHTGGNGNLMMINGSANSGTAIWSQVITVQPNTNYAFSTWLQSIAIGNPAKLQFTINGKRVGADFDALAATCSWKEFYTTWNSGNNTTASISIINKNIGASGNDFAIDDISFAPVFIKRDSVNITVEIPLVKTNADTTVCVNSPVQLTSTGAQDYSWSPSTGLSNGSISNPVATTPTSMQYIVTGTTVNGCTAKDTVNVAIFTKPIFGLSADTAICKNTTVSLFASGGTAYSWSPAATLNNASGNSPVASPTSNTLYYVTITSTNTCNYLDSVQVDIRPDPIFTVSAPRNLCLKDSLQLNASGGNIYSWQPAIGLSDAGIANPMSSPATSTDYSVTITETTCNQSTTLATRISVLPLPIVKATRSTDIDCSTDRSQLTGSGATQYSWTPSASLSNPAIFNPVARPQTTTNYVMMGTDAAGCKNYDSVVVKVTGGNKGGYLMPNAFTPDNNGLNDCYGIKYWGVIQEVEFSIFNRWGERIFFTRDASQCWDGTYKGKKQDGGVYVYMIKAKTFCDASVFRKGTFVLVR